MDAPEIGVSGQYPRICGIVNPQICGYAELWFFEKTRQKMKPNDYFNAAKERLNITSDYELAKRIGTSDKHMPAMRKGTRAVPLDVAYRLAITLELDPALVVADLESQREKNENRRAFWAGFISHARAAAVMLACMLAWSFSGGLGSEQRALGGLFNRPRGFA